MIEYYLYNSFRYSILIILIIFCSCEKKTILKADKENWIEVVYYDKDSLDIIYKDTLSKGIIKEGIFVNKDNEIYYKNYNGEEYLRMSIKIDTIFQVEREGLDNEYIDIKQLSKDIFESSYFFINDDNEKINLLTLYYDKNYKINKIVRNNHTYTK